MGDQEIEIKLYLSDMPAFRRRVEQQGAELVEARLHEVNLRYDTPDGGLTRTAQVLRLRQDNLAHLTYKGKGDTNSEVYIRREIEFTVGDFQAARLFLEALGYTVSLMYEKYRTSYSLDGVIVTLDEMPFGNFSELEGPDAESIRRVADMLGVNWEARIADSYTALFTRLKNSLGLTFRDLSFENFKGIIVSSQALGVQPADSSLLSMNSG
jgi:adenylate cyclase class 2